MIDSTTPTRSILPGRGSRDSGTSTVTSTTPAMTMGTLIRKTEPHQKCSSNSPPTIGPIATPSPTAPAQTPMARPRSRGSNTLAMVDKVDGMTDAAPRAVRRHEGADANKGTADAKSDPPAEPVGQDARGEEQTGEDQRVRVDR